MKNYLCLLLICCSIAIQGLAQISVSYPLENCVFQRDQNNRSTIHIAGNFTDFLDVIEVRLTPVHSGWGQSSDWITINQNPRNGYYSGSVEWSGGWYKMEIQGRRGNSVIAGAVVNKVGIGEVFLIAGQSNAQGFFNQGAASANDERVVHVDYDGTFGPNQPFPYPGFSQLQANDVIAPRGKSSWFWGTLGDAITSRLNVPVLFYNVAWDGSGIKAWQESISGTAWSAYVPDIPFEPAGMPYANLRHVMRNYVSITGIRAVLWIQGEADNDVGTSQSDYYASLQTVINQTRNEFNRNLSWVVSRTSYTIRAGSSTRIIGAQNQIIQNLSNIFAGPEMDQIQVPRPDGYHLSGGGLVTAAIAWNNYLNADFFNRSIPHKSKAPIGVSLSCQNNNITITSDAGYNSHRWNNGSGGISITPGQGEYQFSAYDSEGDYRFSPKIRIPGNVGSLTPPTISSVGNAEVCEGGSLTLVSSSDQNPIWSTGQNGREIQISSPGQYNVSIENPLGCRSTSSNFTVAKSNKILPNPPVISANRATELCDGEEVILTSNTGTNTFWSNGSNNQTTTGIRVTGEFSARTRDTEGCFSEASNKLNVVVNPLPLKPTISSNGTTTFCDGGEVTLQSSYGQGNTWSNNTTNQNLTVRQTGDFSVSVTDGKGCRNTSDVVKVTVNPLPAPPLISSTRPLSFCQGDYTILTSNEQHIVIWSIGDNNRQVNIGQPGEYWAQARDANGCISNRSNTLTVQVNPLPERPTISALGNTTFCENSEVVMEAPDATGYSWSTGESTKRITIETTKTISLQTINEFGCRSPQSASVSTQTMPIPAPPVISASGPTEICDNDFVELNARGAAPFIWSTDETSSSVKIEESGSFSAKSISSNGCISNVSNTIEVSTRVTPAQPVLQKNGSFALRVSNHMNGSLYHWVDNGVSLPDELGDLIRISKSGEYSAQAYYKYTDILTCTSEFSTTEVFQILDEHKSLNVFPNPVRGDKVWLESSEILTNATVSIYSMQGKLIFRKQFDKVVVPVLLDVPAGASGVFIVRVESAGFNASEKFIVLN